MLLKNGERLKRSDATGKNLKDVLGILFPFLQPPGRHMSSEI
jgi:hypothetical protein